MAKNLTQLKLGEMLSYSDKAISKWERAEAVPDAYVLKRLSEVFDVSVDYIMTDQASHREVKPSPVNRNIHYHVMRIAMTGVWTLALLVFIVFWMTGFPEYMVFVYTVPNCFACVEQLVGKGKKQFLYHIFTGVECHCRHIFNVFAVQLVASFCAGHTG
jgi:transcriptional regulator with XRE-family HTH domain